MPMRVLAVLLLVAGVWILVYKGISVPKESEGKLGPIEVKVNHTERYQLPTWLGVGCVAAGGGLLLWSAQKKK